MNRIAVWVTVAALLGWAGAVRAAELSVGDLSLVQGDAGTVVVSGAVSGESTFGVTITVEIVPRTGNSGTVTFTAAPPADITQAGDPWPDVGTFSVFDTDQTGSVTLNGSVDDNGTFLAEAVTFSGPLTNFPIITSADAEGVWDVLLSTSAGDSGWEGLATTLVAGTITVTSTECTIDEDCDDGAFCNGAEVCVSGTCEAGSDPCTGQLCDESLDACVDCLSDADCSNGTFCDGAEVCSSGTCGAGSDPCPGQLCDETTDACVDCFDNADCDDGAFCNGSETCSNGACVSGADPCPDQACDETNDACVPCQVDGECDDGLFCNGAETCSSGTCLAGTDPCSGVCDEATDTCLPDPAILSAGDLSLSPGGSGNVTVSGQIGGESTFGVTVFVELIPRAGSVGTVTFTPAPPTDIVQAGDPWPSSGTFTAFDTDQTGSLELNGSIDDNGTFVAEATDFSGDLAAFPVVASSNAGGVWDVVLSTSAGDSTWEGVTTTLLAGTITVDPSLSLSVNSFAMPPGATTDLVVSGRISGQQTFGVNVLVELKPRADATGTVRFTTSPPVDIRPIDDPWPSSGVFTPFDTDTTGSDMLNGSVDDNGSFITGPVTFDGDLGAYPVTASTDASGTWDATLRTSAGDSGWEGLTAVLIDGAITVTAGACVNDVDCDDGNSCTTDTCVAGVCEHEVITGSCDDGDLCTINDTCSGSTCVGEAVGCSSLDDACNVGTCNASTGECEAVPTNEGGSCDDGDPCTDSDTCASGGCAGTSIPGCINCDSAADCDDNNVCTDDACVGGACTFTNNTVACDDGDACTTNDACADGVCLGGAPPDCDDGNPCTTDTCDPVTGCASANNTDPCDDGDPCTDQDTCSAGSCIGSPIGGCVNCTVDSDCNDNNVCTSEVCVGGACEFTNLMGSCNDGDPCTTSDACSAGVCSGTPKDCSSFTDTCNVGTCNSTTGGCEAVATNEGGACDDGLSCTTGDACTDGECKGTLVDPAQVDLVWSPAAPSVEQGETIRLDLIARSAVCATLPVGSIDAAFTWDPALLELVGRIRPSPSPWTSSGFPDDSGLDGLNADCGPDTFCSSYTGLPFNDGDAFWQGFASFRTGAAVPPEGLLATTIEFRALDGTAGTSVVIEPTVGSFTQTRILGADDFLGVDLTGVLPTVTIDIDECTANSDCDDGNLCTTDVCNAGVCEYTNNTLSCNDGLFCTASDVCSGGTCVGSGDPCTAPLLCDDSLDACVECLSAADCDDGNVCTTDSCNSTGTCVHTNNTLSCDDGLFCTASDVCSGGVCVGSSDTCAGQVCDEPNDRCVECLTVADCDDGNPCTDDLCTSNVCDNPPNSDPCDDGLFCTSNDTCTDGACVGGPDPCTPPQLCSESFDACVQCLTDTDCDDGNVCTTDTCLFGTCSNENNTAPCDDGQFCTATDVCADGVCVGSGDPCPGQLCDETGGRCVDCFTVGDCADDGVACTVESCDDGACTHTPDDTLCDDGTFCNGAEFCDANGGCVTPGNPCDDPDLCDEAQDLCGCAVPTAMAEGSRYIRVTPHSGQTPVAIQVRGVDPNVACVAQFVQNDGALGTTAVFRAPSSWDTVHVRGFDLPPDATFEIRTQCETGQGLDFSAGVTARTWAWADTNNSGGLVDIQDIVLILDGFAGRFDGTTPFAVDLWGSTADACLPQRVIDLQDVLRALDAFEQRPYPCGDPCP